MAHDIRSFGKTLLVAADVLAAVTAAGVVVTFYVLPGSFGTYDDATRSVSISRESPAMDLAFLVALVLLAANILYVLYGRRPATPLHYVPSNAPGGVVKVSRDALEAGLRTAGEGLDVVSRLRVTVESGGVKRIVVRAHFQAPEGVSNLEASRQLRSALSERFNEMVRLTDGVKAEFDIEFLGYSGKLSRAAASEAPPQDEDPSPFTGPQYPILGDDPFQEKVNGG